MYPLDTQVNKRFFLYVLDCYFGNLLVFLYITLNKLLQKCKLEVGSYTNDTSYLKFNTILNHDSNAEKKTVLDYYLLVEKLKEEDSQWHWEGTNKNYSLGGFEMKFKRHRRKYIVEYYFPSCLFVATSWVREANT